METEVAWYSRLFFVQVCSLGVASILWVIIRAKRMTGPRPSRAWVLQSWITFIVGCVLLWFVSFSINPAFWIGLAIVIFGEVVYTLGFIAMREHPEKKKALVDWGIYKVNRHSHVMSSIICLLGVIVMGWTASVVYGILWIYFVLYVIMVHFAVVDEERLNIERFGQKYEDYMKRVPRYFPTSIFHFKSQ